MNERWVQVREKLAGFWNQYSKTQKWVLASSAALLLLFIILLTYFFTRTQYEIAFQDLDSGDASAIIEYLDGSGIPYKLGPGGSSISVPSAKADKVKVDVGSQGLVQNGSIGFAEMSKSSSTIGTTDQEFKVKKLNALNGEVQQLLQSMQGVKRAKVLVNLPEETVFLNDSDKERATASVVMTFKPGYRPKQDEIDSYYNLVKTAVPSMDIGGITITSPTGDLAPSSKIGGSGSVNGTILDQQFEIQRQFETGIKSNIQNFLAQIVGMDNMVVSVMSSLNFDQKSTTVNKVLPLENNDNKGIIISEQQSNESYTGANGSAGGVAGTGQTDVPNYPSGSAGQSSSSEKSASTTNYEPSREKTDIAYAPYQVKDLSISVGVDSSVITPEKQQVIQQMLVNNVRTLLADSGQTLTDADLNNRVSIIAQAFNSNANGTKGTALSGYWLAGIGVAALALLGGAGYFVYRRRRAAQEAAAAAELETPRVEMPTIDLESVTNESQVRKQLEGLAKRKPDEFVNLLRTWLVDE
ncbi:flagellar basal-body MS-ring/collar protein FliF [Cohnella nanjingensis]|uniref:Flagellar M-ring protein n=1 Tax=Cohnella nanjingensis TaxID=1387779 RepID=A0A7X0RVT3_9BACL|nr:flagellar basal-body MS-ring/collar protein FliF [Cohnella nanjingensis]MBB6674592.1 flagellar M-ring protein FliF [Cohnella nanjingensis]